MRTCGAAKTLKCFGRRRKGPWSREQIRPAPAARMEVHGGLLFGRAKVKKKTKFRGVPGSAGEYRGVPGSSGEFRGTKEREREREKTKSVGNPEQMSPCTFIGGAPAPREAAPGFWSHLRKPEGITPTSY